MALQAETRRMLPTHAVFVKIINHRFWGSKINRFKLTLHTKWIARNLQGVKVGM